MKKRADRAPPDDIGDCKPSKALIDELSALEAMLEQRDEVEEVERKVVGKDSESESEDGQRE